MGAVTLTAGWAATWRAAPDRVVLVDQLRLNTMGKVRRVVLRSLATDPHPSGRMGA